MCTRTELNNILEAFYNYSKKYFGDQLKEIILYGSYARGDFDDESDVDIAVIVKVPRESENDFNQPIVKMIGDLYEKFGYSIVLSPIVISSDFFEKWKNDLPFYRNVDQEGVRIVA